MPYLHPGMLQHDACIQCSPGQMWMASISLNTALRCITTEHPLACPVRADASGRARSKDLACSTAIAAWSDSEMDGSGRLLASLILSAPGCSSASSPEPA